MPETVSFAIGGKHSRLSRSDVDRAADELPEGDGDVRVWALDHPNGRRLPLKPLFRRATGIEKFTSQRAQSVFGRLGYTVVDVTREPRTQRVDAAPTAIAIEPPSDETHRAAPDVNNNVTILRCAVEYAATRPQMNADDVIAAARAFEQWVGHS
jgi:hypothetical protein